MRNVLEQSNLTSQQTLNADGADMTQKKEKHYVEELKEMIKEKEPKEPVEKVFAMFCERHATSMEECRKYYDQLVSKGEVEKEKGKR